MAGLKIKDKKGDIIKNLEGITGYEAVKTKEDLKNVLLEVLKSNDAAEPNKKAIEGSIDFISK